MQLLGSDSWNKILVALGVFITGGIVGYIGGTIIPHAYTSTISLVREGGYQFINPLLACDFSDNLPYDGFSSLKRNFSATIADAKRQGLATRVAVYFRDLDDGLWTGINEDDRFSPASLDKVPLAIAQMRNVTLAALATTTLYVPAGPDLNAQETFTPSEPIALGHEYTLGALIDAMIIQSDNNATDVIYKSVATTTLLSVYKDFAIAPSDSQDEVMSPKMYSRVLRILYNGSYLGRNKSEALLKTLSQSTFSHGLTLALPPSATVAHKFGERTFIDTGGNIVRHELHDCGIVYYPPHPYLLCVMTEGSDFTELEGVIKTLSGQAFVAVGQGLLESKN